MLEGIFIYFSLPFFPHSCIEAGEFFSIFAMTMMRIVGADNAWAVALGCSLIGINVSSPVDAAATVAE